MYLFISLGSQVRIINEGRLEGRIETQVHRHTLRWVVGSGYYYLCLNLT